MNENDLHEQLARSTSWTQDLTVDPAEDLARGRRRLRRRRAGLGAVSAFAVALVATGGSLATAHLGGSTDPAGVAGQPQVCTPRGRVLTAPDAASTNVRSNHLDVFASYADPDRRHLVGRAAGGVGPTETGPCGRDGWAGARSDWSEAGGVGWVAIAVMPKAVHERPNDGGIPHPRADTCGLADDRSTFTACWVTTTSDGKQVRVGTRGKQAYWASYLRPDGQLAIATVEGDGRRSDPGTFGGAEPATTNPVEEPSVTLAELISTVTDPSLDTAG